MNIFLILEQDVRNFWAGQIHNYFEYEYEDVMFTAPISIFGWTNWELRYVFIDWDSEFDTSVWSEYYDDATPLKSQNGNNLIKIYMSSVQK